MIARSPKLLQRSLTLPLLALALVAGLLVEQSRQAEREAALDAWSQRQQDPALSAAEDCWSGQRPSRWDQQEGLSWLDRCGAKAWLSAGPGQGAWLLDWATRADSSQWSLEALRATATTEMDYLGHPLMRGGDLLDVPLRVGVLALQRWRLAAEQSCTSCSLTPVALPPVMAGPEGASAQILLEREARASLPEGHPLGSTLLRIREEGQWPSEWETSPGHAGMLALLLASRAEAEDLSLLLEWGVSGPTASDRLASLFAAQRLLGDQLPAAAALSPLAQEGLARLRQIQQESL